MTIAERVPSEYSQPRYIADIFQNAVFFSAALVRQCCLEEHLDRHNCYVFTDQYHSELSARYCVGLSYRKKRKVEVNTQCQDEGTSQFQS